MSKISILGATGYTGVELVRILSAHPGAEIVGLGSQNYVDQPFSKVYPHFSGVVDMECRAVHDPRLINEADVIFLALPHGHSAELAEKCVQAGKMVVDLGADFRIKNPAVYQEWYKTAGPGEDILKQAVYGLPEINRQRIKAASIVANPGCYPTTIILGLAPLLKEKLIDIKHIIADSKSGVSGSGRSLKTTSLYSEVAEDFKAYGLPHHRHIPEIEQELSALAGEDIVLTFTPHLLPMTRGMLSTIYCTPNKKCSSAEIRELYHGFYAGEPFVRVLASSEYPQTKWVAGTNYCDLGLLCDERTGRITVLSAIDNVVKGASGQAVQNMNIMLGFPETAGLPRLAIYP